MADVYQEVPVLESERYLLRFVREEDSENLLRIYSDLAALPFFNSDNCHGDNFYYPTAEAMRRAVGFWLDSYKKKWFVRFSIVEKESGLLIGTAEMFKRAADDDFDGAGVLRVDVGSFYERAEVLEEIFALAAKHSFGLFDCERIVTKVPIYAVEREKAARRAGFEKSASLLVGQSDRYVYNGYYEISLPHRDAL